MAKTISESALEYAKNSKPDFWFDAKQDYEAGANTVLEEIEDFAETHFSDYLEPIKLLREKIKELKGE